MKNFLQSSEKRIDEKLVQAHEALRRIMTYHMEAVIPVFQMFKDIKKDTRQELSLLVDEQIKEVEKIKGVRDLSSQKYSPDQNDGFSSALSQVLDYLNNLKKEI